MPENYIGLMSGTSVDSVDAVLVNFADQGVDILATHSHPLAETLQFALRRAAQTPPDEPIENIGSLDRQMGESLRDAALELLDKSGVTPGDVMAIGSHGQTVRHQPNALRPYTLQIGNPDTIASGTGITTVADFRAADIAAGGQGAPLVPPFHAWLFGQASRLRVVVNIGGIANITVLPANDAPVTGFDTGPGNTLLDHWIRRHRGENYDENGAWAASGTCNDELLERLLTFSYFRLAPPKSTGLEDFNLDWLAQYDVANHDPADVQATLAELTARSIAQHVTAYASDAREVFVCGGGAHNAELMRRLARNLPETEVDTSRALGLDPDWVEAVAFAWLAMRTTQGLTGNLPSVTGAGREVVLGTIHSP
ncbi:MAG: anhydro-N-acetylmuramic acid kinase [Woeseiaceae bacterium]|jgi:anhydro-N-acetylmuramic acid kinase